MTKKPNRESVEKIILDNFPSIYGYVFDDNYKEELTSIRELKKLFSKDNPNYRSIINRVIRFHNVFGNKAYEMIPHVFGGVYLIKMNTVLHCLGLWDNKPIDLHFEKMIMIELNKVK